MNNKLDPVFSPNKSCRSKQKGVQKGSAHNPHAENSTNAHNIWSTRPGKR